MIAHDHNLLFAENSDYLTQPSSGRHGRYSYLSRGTLDQCTHFGISLLPLRPRAVGRLPEEVETLFPTSLSSSLDGLRQLALSGRNTIGDSLLLSPGYVSTACRQNKTS